MYLSNITILNRASNIPLSHTIILEDKKSLLLIFPAIVDFRYKPYLKRLKLQQWNGRMLSRNGALCGWKLKVMKAVNLTAE